uniref:distal membrane-arm assembly complex protein 1 n=1 Tax=Lonchura striata TaxID=40157 RepID=UPI000B4CABC3|nr:distal membrane-arm assembly complex protein 1 [Lonchura striata domestica]
MSRRGAEPAEAPPEARPLFGGCWSCRLLSGAGLLLAALWVYRGPRGALRSGAPPSMAAIAQITLAAGLGAWAIVILADPVGRRRRPEP